MAHILQISPFAFADNPKSGGLIRIAEVRKAYERAGHSIETSHIVTRKKDLRFPLDMQLGWWDRHRRTHLGEPTNLGPIRQRWATMRSRALFEQLRSKAAIPDIIHLEHPWAIRLAAQLREAFLSSGCHTKIVYSSHNIEHELCRAIWESSGVWNTAARNLFKTIQEAEIECVQQSDICWAVSEADGKTLTRLGARKVLIAPNGCRLFPARQERFVGEVRTPYVVFIGGNYQPNFEGFMEWVQPDLEFLPQGTQIISIGTIKDRLDRDPRCKNAIARGQLINLGTVSQEVLDQLILHAKAILLPISQGGGTNLKTAEALCSPRKVIATPTAMRGFEKWLDAPGVFLAKTPASFRATIVQALGDLEDTKHARPGVEALQWENCLSGAVKNSIDTTPMVADTL